MMQVKVLYSIISIVIIMFRTTHTCTDSVVVSLPDSLSGGPGFYPRQRSICPGLAQQACYPAVGKLVAVSVGVEGSSPLIQPHGTNIRRVISVRT